MAIVFEHSIDVPQPPHQVFALLDDFSKAPLWLKRCEGAAKEGTGPNAAGDKVRYAYRDGGRHGVMDGVIVVHEDGKHLNYKYFDKRMHLIIDFRMTPGEGLNEGGTHLVHRIEITPHSFMARLMSPMLKGRIPKQTIEAMQSLRALLARG